MFFLQGYCIKKNLKASTIKLYLISLTHLMTFVILECLPIFDLKHVRRLEKRVENLMKTTDHQIWKLSHVLLGCQAARIYSTTIRLCQHFRENFYKWRGKRGRLKGWKIKKTRRKRSRTSGKSEEEETDENIQMDHENKRGMHHVATIYFKGQFNLVMIYEIENYCLPQLFIIIYWR